MKKKCLFLSISTLPIPSLTYLHKFFFFYSPVFERNEYTIKVLESMPINSQVNDHLNMHLKEAFYELMSL